MGLHLKEERKQEVLLPTVLLHPKVPVEQDIRKSLLCCMQQKGLQKGRRRGMLQKYSAELIGSSAGSMCLYICIHVYTHTYILSGRYEEILSKTEQQWAAIVAICRKAEHPEHNFYCEHQKARCCSDKSCIDVLQCPVYPFSHELQKQQMCSYLTMVPHVSPSQ